MADISNEASPEESAESQPFWAPLPWFRVRECKNEDEIKIFYLARRRSFGARAYAPSNSPLGRMIGRGYKAWEQYKRKYGNSCIG